MATPTPPREKPPAPTHRLAIIASNASNASTFATTPRIRNYRSQQPFTSQLS
jgi:flagellar basal body rod protein FlgC